MKSGASDPFGDEPEAEEADRSVDAEADHQEAGDPDSRGDPSGREDDATVAAVEGGIDSSGGTQTASSGAEAGSAAETGLSREELPFVLRRDKVKDERPEVHQLFVQQETHERAVDAERELSDRLDADLARTDAREAMYLAGMEHLDRATEILREWGYDL
jgi:hypothetical protein